MEQTKRFIEAIANVRSIMKANNLTIEDIRQYWFDCEPFMEEQ